MAISPRTQQRLVEAWAEIHREELVRLGALAIRPVLEGEVFAALQDLTLFNTVELDPTFGTIQWPNGADFDPETLHDWHKYRDDLVAKARRWAKTSEPAP